MFVPFPKIPRWTSEIIITEKIDGTNAQVYIVHKDDPDCPDIATLEHGDYRIFAGSRKRYIAPGSDNFGFASWVWDNVDYLINLGPGRHFGEWWGAGIQRRYGQDKKYFSLFNINRWGVDAKMRADTMATTGCMVVPVLYRGIPNDIDEVIASALSRLKDNGSAAAPGFMDPEGIMIYHERANSIWKYPFDPAPKGK